MFFHFLPRNKGYVETNNEIMRSKKMENPYLCLAEDSP